MLCHCLSLVSSSLSKQQLKAGLSVEEVMAAARSAYLAAPDDRLGTGFWRGARALSRAPGARGRLTAGALCSRIGAADTVVVLDPAALSQSRRQTVAPLVCKAVPLNPPAVLLFQGGFRDCFAQAAPFMWTPAPSRVFLGRGCAREAAAFFYVEDDNRDALQMLPLRCPHPTARAQQPRARARTKPTKV